MPHHIIDRLKKLFRGRRVQEFAKQAGPVLEGTGVALMVYILGIPHGRIGREDIRSGEGRSIRPLDILAQLKGELGQVSVRCKAFSQGWFCLSGTIFIAHEWFEDLHASADRFAIFLVTAP